MDDGAELRTDWRTPNRAHLALTDPHRDEILARHDASMERGLPTYVDPLSGFGVFTAGFLAARRFCCGSGCRHCPFVT